MLKIYLSHAIRGAKGADATEEDMRHNCERIKGIAYSIRQAITADIELYVPAEHEEFVSIAYRDKYLNEGQILDIDCKIIDTCDMVIAYVPYGDELQGGRKIEIDHAIATNKEWYVFKKVDSVIEFVTRYLMEGM